ncbi:chemotaxis protein [Paramagnetospirillum marisnigri]|uniref:Chemotaxis protein n=1 Tax=Paramagnetospirillum marisnigri TaxID=1285242 RepID=A0A178MPM7_9PROT|nr:response regulator [Paramagnetospirillum marisnigri]OAN50589.1 chemotaxis protein [Paramagnetospirillum marisnigri]
MSETIVLVVDDSRVSRMMTKSAIERLRPDWVVLEAASGEDALSAVALDRPDFILMDVNMPGMGGLEAARQLRPRLPKAGISLLTANIQDSIRDQAAAMGVGFMSKPLRDEDLAAFLAAGRPPS